MKKLLVVAMVSSCVMFFGAGLQNAKASEQISAIGVGSEAPCVVLRDVQPDDSQIEQCIRTRPEGKKYLLLEFSSVTCSACQVNLPVLSQLSNDVSATAGTRIVLIDRNEALIRRYLQETPKTLIHFPVSLDTQRAAKNAYGIYATPTLFVLDQNNRVILMHVGTLSANDVEEIKELVSH